MFRKILFNCLILLALSNCLLAQVTPEIPILELRQTIEKEIAPRKTDSYKIRLEAGQFAQIEIIRKDIDLGITLVDSEDTNFIRVPRLIGVSSKIVEIAADSSQVFQLRISVLGNSAGKYGVKFTELRSATEKEINLTKGQKFQDQALKIFRKAPTFEGTKQSLKKYQEAAQSYFLADDLNSYSQMLTQIGYSYSQIGNPQKAEESFKLAIQYAEPTKDKEILTVLLNNTSVFYSNIGKYQNALKYFNQALVLEREKGSITGESRALSNIASVYRAIGDFAKAETFYLQALKVLPDPKTLKSGTERGVLDRQANAFSGLARISLLMGNKQNALDNINQALEINKTLRNLGNQAKYLNNLGLIYFEMGEFNKSIESFNQSLEISLKQIYETDEAQTYNHLGNIYLTQNELKKAEENFAKSLRVYRQLENLPNLAQTLLGLAKVKQKQGKLEEAQEYLDEALKLIEGFGGNLNSNQLRETFSSQLNDFYSFQTNLLLERHKLEPNKNFDKQAWLATERGRARSLLALLNESNANIYEGVDKDLLAKEREIYNLLNARLENFSSVLTGRNKPETAEVLRKEIEQIRLDYQLIQAETREKSPRYAALTQPKIVSVDEIQNQLLDSNTVILSFSLGRENSLLWLIGKDKAEPHLLPKQEVIETKARQVYELLNARNKEIKFEVAADKQARIGKADSELSKVSAELSEILLSPVANQLKNKRIVVVADGALQYIPFASLKVNNRYLIETNEVTNLPSVSTLSVLRSAKKPSAAKTIAVLADPVFEKDDERFSLNKNKPQPNQVTGKTRSAGENISWEDFTGEETGFYIPRLPYTRKEAETIAKLSSPAQSKIALDFASTRQLALSDELNQYRIIHFATHGILNSRTPELSGLVFSLVDEKGSPINGFLRADEIFNLKLSADLVVLSGCKTGLGKEIRGEGLVGMTRGFMYAGASRVMVSLWDVDDQATAELMKRFYQNLLGKKMSNGQSLREAQLSMLKDKQYSAPFFWSAFTLHGEF